MNRNAEPKRIGLRAQEMKALLGCGAPTVCFDLLYKMPKRYNDMDTLLLFNSKDHE